jgi:hypothetical protein
MKKTTLLYAFPLFIGLSLPSFAVHAQASSPAPALDLGDLTQGDPFYYTSDQHVADSNGQKHLVGIGRPNTTHSQIPHLPVYFGHMSTNYTYRFVTIAEQVLTMIGEGKHGAWRVQESGTVREYLKKGAAGLPENADLFAPEHLAKIESDYSSYLPDESWEGYKYPDQRLADDGALNFIDLPITHAKYQGKYAEHVPIDLPNYYCTMSNNDYPYAKQAMNFAFAQPGANQVGPLGQRAGFDIKENYPNVIRMTHLPDARSWVNVGQEGQDDSHVKWEAIDTTKTEAEYYLIERPFFNKPYLFLAAVFNNKDNDDHRYMRPAGAYFDSLPDSDIKPKTEVTAQPRFHLENGETKKAIGLPVYGVHHPDRSAFDAGGACPLKGGDWGRYPGTAGGSGWPTQYEEVTPLCDAVLLDLKFYTNLDGRSWNDPNKYLANAGVGTKTLTYKMQPGEYGVFADAYNTSRDVKNAEAQVLPAQLTLTYPEVAPPVSYVAAPPLQLARMTPAEETTCRPVHH